jgi:hypothetical protein
MIVRSRRPTSALDSSAKEANMFQSAWLTFGTAGPIGVAMFTVAVCVSSRPPEHRPQGPPGRRVEYFMNRPRHRAIVPMIVVGVLCLVAAGAMLWNSGSHSSAIWFWLISTILLVIARVVWRHGVSQVSRQETQAADQAINVSKPAQVPPSRKLTNGSWTPDRDSRDDAEKRTEQSDL